MENVIKLLETKNLHLTKFLELNESELLNFTEGKFENLEQFYHNRETILEIIHSIDRQISQTQEMSIPPEMISSEEKARILAALRSKNDLVTEILSQDLQILSAIEKEKSCIIKDLAQTQLSKKAAKGYQSGANQNSRIDEEV